MDPYAPSPPTGLDVGQIDVPRRHPFVALMLLSLFVVGASLDLPGSIRHVVSMGNPLLAIGTFTSILMIGYCVAACAACAIVEGWGSLKRMRLVPLVLLPIALLSIGSAYGAFVDMLNGNFVEALRSSPSVAGIFVWIPTLWIYFGLAVRRYWVQRSGEPE